MNADEYRPELRSYLEKDTGSLIEIIPGGSGICHIANKVTLAEWDPAFVSTKPGRWTEHGQPSKYFADQFEVCFQEVGYSVANPPDSDTVFELWETCYPLSAVNIDRLPDYLRQPLYHDHGPPSIKWRNSHILLTELKRSPVYSPIGCIYAPSASGILSGSGGMCLVANPFTDPIKRIATKTYAEWKAGA